jgi:hypothetical protein
VTEEPIVPWSPSRDAVQPLSAVRSTLIGSSIISLRTHGFEQPYLAALDPEHRDAVLYTPAGVWLPVVRAEAHYAACDRLGLTDQAILAIGSEVAKATQKSVLAGILRLAREVGTTPWVLYAGCGKYWGRMFQGSAIAISKLGPKEARFEVAGCSLAASPYWRCGLRGLLTAVSEPFAKKVYLRDVPSLNTSMACGFRISWV